MNENKDFCYLYWKKTRYLLLSRQMQKFCSLPWGTNPCLRIWLIVLLIRAVRARYIVTKLLSLDVILEKRQSRHQNAQSAPHGRILVLRSLGKESVEISSKNDRETEESLYVFYHQEGP